MTIKDIKLRTSAGFAIDATTTSVAVADIAIIGEFAVMSIALLANKSIFCHGSQITD